MLFLCRASPFLQRTALSSPLRFFAPNRSAINRKFANTAVRFSIEMETVDTSERLAQLRELMKRNNLDVYSKSTSFFFSGHEQRVAHPLNLVVPSEDSHQSEYIAHCDARRGTYNPNMFGRIAYWRSYFSRIHLWLYRLSRNGRHLLHRRRAFDRRTLFQPSCQTAR